MTRHAPKGYLWAHEIVSFIFCAQKVLGHKKYSFCAEFSELFKKNNQNREILRGKSQKTFFENIIPEPYACQI